jgi:hypothetical protein
MNKYMEKHPAPDQTLQPGQQPHPQETHEIQSEQPQHDEYQTQLMKSLLESLQKTLLISKDTLENKPSVYPETPSESIIIEDTPLTTE